MVETWITLEEAARRSGRAVDHIRAAIVLGEIESKPTADESSYLVPGSLFPAAPHQRWSWKRWAAAALLFGSCGGGYYLHANSFRGAFVCARCGAEEGKWFISVDGWEYWSESHPSRIGDWMAKIDPSSCKIHDWRFIQGGGDGIF